MKVKVLVAGKYNGQNLRSVECQAGDELDTKDWYAEKLIEGKLAEAVEPETAAVAAVKKAVAAVKKAAAKPKAKPDKQADATPEAPKNVFLE